MDRIVLIRLSPEEANQRSRGAVLIRECEDQVRPDESVLRYVPVDTGGKGHRMAVRGLGPDTSEG